MLSAVLGTLIISALTTALMLSIQFAEKVFNDAGRYPIREDEIKILQNANLLDEDNKNLNLLNTDILGLLENENFKTNRKILSNKEWNDTC